MSDNEEARTGRVEGHQSPAVTAEVYGGLLPKPTLTDFLLARIAEDEERVDTIPDWYCTDSARGDGWGSRGECPLCGKYMFDGTESATKDAFWEHYEDTHRRTRALAECEAKRLLLEFARNDDWTAPDYNGALLAPGQDRGDVLAYLALPYADHPDYRDEWRP